jgi:hypothetical protein
MTMTTEPAGDPDRRLAGSHPDREEVPAVTIACADVADGTRPGDLMRQVTEGLTRTGLDVGQSGHDDISQIDIACDAGRCTLWVSDSGDAEWEYWPGQDPDPGLAADLAAILLTGHADPCPDPPRGHGRRHLTFKGIVGLDLRARGLDVELAVYTEEDVLNVVAEIVITSPAGTGGAGERVWVSDDGVLTWKRDSQPGEPAVTAIVETVTRAIRRLHTPGQPA